MYTKEELESKSDFELSLAICITLDEETLTFDINNWSDMGPLIHENQISLCRFIFYWRASSLLVKGNEHVDHKNILRAAAIVYLLVGE